MQARPHKAYAPAGWLSDVIAMINYTIESRKGAWLFVAYPIRSEERA
jgi:hypothetical protein